MTHRDPGLVGPVELELVEPAVTASGAWSSAGEPRRGRRGHPDASLAVEEEAAVRRATGGLLSVVGGEVWATKGMQFDTVGRVGAALVDLGHGYVSGRGAHVPVEAAQRHRGVAGVGWALAVAVVRPDIPRLVRETLDLAAVLGVPRAAWDACTRYAELAACLMAGWPTREALALAWEGSAGEGAQLSVGGDAAIDGLRAGVWALSQPGGVADVAEVLAGITTPDVVAAATGLVGLRDGVEAIPDGWLGCRSAADCRVLAPALVRARQPLELAR